MTDVLDCLLLWNILELYMTDVLVAVQHWSCI